jgi:hypothetical protein
VSKLALILLTLCVTTIPTYAEEQPRPTIGAAVTELHSLALQAGVGRTAPPGGSSRHCCNKKGALIGAAVGAATGFFLTLSACDAGDCTSTYVRVVGLCGGIGAAIGAFADAKPGPAPFPDRRIHVNGIVSPKVRAVLTTVRLAR